ncbi:MAG: nitrilase-related carbon-nitrogen hydrolase [Phycisphaerales bacterium]
MPTILAAQYDIVWEDKAANHRLVEELVEREAPPEGSLLVLPEMFDTGFSMKVSKLSEEATDHASERWAADFAKRRGLFVQAASIRRRDADDKGTNNAVVFDPNGALVCRYEKVFPFSGGREPEWYRGGRALSTFDWRGVTVCPLVCYDLRFPEIWRLAALDLGAELFTIGANWPSARADHWSTLLTARAIENQAYVCGVNRSGADPFLEYPGRSKIVDPKGRTLAEADDESSIVLRAEIDPDAAPAWREAFGALRDARREFLGRLD